MGSVETSLSDLVTIIVKAPNQQIADQTIKCHLNWSIKKLKDYLSQVYPSKPKLEEQKLIYSGKLLTDTAILKDVLRTYEGQENHTVHLVCTTKMSSQKSNKSQTSYSTNSSSTYGDTTSSNYRNANSDHDAAQTSVPPFTGQNSEAFRVTPPSTHLFGQFNANQIPMMNNFDPRFMWPSLSPFGNINDVDVNQQFAMMQQAYAQYISQYMQMMGQPGFGYVTSPLSQPVPVTSQPAATLFNNINNRVNNNNVLPNERNQDRNVARENQPAGVLGIDGEEERNNRDWLDWFYVVSRLIVLFSVIYFYSTPMRLILVFLLICMFFLHQNMRQQNDIINLNNQVNNNNNNNVNNNLNNNNNNNNEARDNTDNQNENASPDRASSSSTDSSSDSNSEANEQPTNSNTRVQPADSTVQPVQERLSPLAITLLAVRTFFLSLIPEQQTL